MSHRVMWHLIRRRNDKPRFRYKGAGAAALLAILTAGFLLSGIRHKIPEPPIAPEPPVNAPPPPTSPPIQTPPIDIPKPEPIPKADGCPEGCATPPPGCEVKGNISKEGERIYHLPGDRYYDKTIISPEKGERWFCTAREAERNGWRHAKV